MIVMNGTAIYHPLKDEFSDIKYIEDNSRKLIDRIIDESGINAFRYVYNENRFTCFYDSLEEAGSRTYFINNTHNQISEVEAKVKDSLRISMYSIVNKAEVIDRLYEKIRDTENLLIYSYANSWGIARR